MAESNALTRQFDDAAQLYDEVRPRYPEEIVEHIGFDTNPRIADFVAQYDRW